MPLAALRADWEIARRGYARYAAYRAATIAGLFTNTVFGFLRSSALRDLSVEETDIEDVVRRIYAERQAGAGDDRL